MDLASLGKDPIRPDQPAGQDVRYEPIFERLQTEMDKLSVPSASGAIDWQKVTDLAATILSTMSKDLLVACYLAVSQIHLNAVDGLASGLTVIRDILEHYWDGLFPSKKRLRGRASAIEWWIEKTETALATVQPSPQPSETLEAVKADLAKIDELLQQYLPEPPLLRPIQRFVEMLPAQVTEHEPSQPAAAAPAEVVEEPQVSRPAAQPPSTASQPVQRPEALKPVPPPVETESVTTLADAEKLANSVWQSLRKVASFLLETEPLNPAAYRYRRIAAWSKITEVPPATDGKTQIPPPPPQVRESIEALKAQGNWHALLLAVEPKVAQFVFWFDLNRWAADALASLGSGHGQAREAVCQETAFLLHRLPGIDDLAFADGTPFADSDTKQWLRQIRPGPGAPTFQESLPRFEANAGAEGQQNIAQIVAEAQGLARRNQIVEAAQLLQAQLKTCAARKDALRWRLALCRILIGSRRPDTAWPHLDAILEHIDAHRLEDWDPELALESLKLVWSGFANRGDQATQTKAEAVLKRIAKVDPVEALKLAKPP